MKSIPLTKEAHFLDRRSVIGRRMDGSLHVRLGRKDMEVLRRRVFERDRYRCIDCGSLYNLELSHEKPRSAGGDDTEGNTCCRCRICHRRKDLHGQPGHF